MYIVLPEIIVENELLAKKYLSITFFPLFFLSSTFLIHSLSTSIHISTFQTMLSNARIVSRALSVSKSSTPLMFTQRTFSTLASDKKSIVIDSNSAAEVNAAVDAAVKKTPKESFMTRQKRNLASFIFNNQGNMRFYTVYGISVIAFCEMISLTNHAVSLIQDMGFSDSAVANSIYGAGIAHTLAAIGTIKFASYLTSLAGRPSQGVIQEICEHARTHPALIAKLGGPAVPGVFSTVSSIDGSFRFWDDRGKVYDEWIRARLTGAVGDIHSAPFPDQMTSVLKWLNGASIRQAFASTRVERQKLRTSIEEKAVRYAEKNDALLRTQKMRYDYSGWERLWRPRRIQMVMEVTSPDNSIKGMLIAELEKSQTGLGTPGSGGFSRFKTLQFVDLATGEVLDLEGSERPVLLGNAQLTKLFETIPVPTVTEAQTFTQGVQISKLENPVVPPENLAATSPSTSSTIKQ